MSNLHIDCPACGSAIELTETLASPLLAAQSEAHKLQLFQLQRDREVQEADLVQRERVLKLADVEFNSRVATELKKQLANEQQKFTELLDAQKSKIAQAEAMELEARKARATAEESQRNLQLNLQRKVDESLQKEREKAYRDAQLANERTIAEKDRLLADMRAQVDTLQRKGNAHSQQMQGDLCETRVAAAVGSRFDSDTVTRVKTGARGADIMHNVFMPSGRAAGSILVEVKDTNTWQRQWLAKVREDQRAAEANIAVIVSRSLPTGLEQFDCVDGVWVCHEKSLLPLLQLLRHGLLELARERLLSSVTEDARTVTFEYLTGPVFKRRITNMVETYSVLREELEKEKRALTRAWLKREKLLDSMFGSVDGLHCDLQEIIGPGLGSICGLDNLESLAHTELPSK